MAEQGPAKRGDGSRKASGAPGQAFFTGGDRRTHLEQLRHLSQWSRRVLVVTGPRGVGKTTLYRQVSASLEPRAKAARINGALVNSTREVLKATVQGFGLAAPADADARALSDLIVGHAEIQERSERFCVVLIDDAELLEARALGMLVELAARAPLRLVMFGEIRLVPAVQRAASTSSVGWHEIRLNGLDPIDVRAYLEWRLRQQGYTERLPFTDAQVKEIARASEGLPGRIDRLANALLAKLRSRGQEVRRRRFPALHQAILAVLVVAIGFTYLVWHPAGDDDSGGLARVEQLEVPPVRPQPRPASEPESRPTGTTGEAPAAEQPAPADAEPQAAVTEPAPEPVGEAEPARQAEPVIGPRDAAWIMTQPASGYTLQLVTFSTAERAAEYLTRQAEPDVFARFRVQQGGRIFHAVTYGSFETRAAAQQAAARLPDGVGNVQPWVRTFGQVQQAARTALQP